MLYQKGQLLQCLSSYNFFLVLEETTLFGYDISHKLTLFPIRKQINDGRTKPIEVTIKRIHRDGLISYNFIDQSFKRMIMFNRPVWDYESEEQIDELVKMAKPLRGKTQDDILKNNSDEIPVNSNGSPVY